MNTTERLKLLDESTAAVVALLQQADDALFVHKPKPDKWSLAEITRHLNISDKSAYIAIMRSSGPLSAEEIESNRKRVSEMLGSNNTWVAPEAAVPKGIFKTTDEALKTFTGTRNRIHRFALENDMTHAATGFEHPRLGYMSRLQWVEFITWHARHHGRQMAEILQQKGM